MSDWISATIAGLADMGTAALSSGLSYAAQKKLDAKAYRRQVALLQMQQQFAERMSNTAHQREVADLRKAGLNPILSATGGNGATSPVVSAPGVALGSDADINLGSPGDLFANVESASSARLNKALADKAKADTVVANATAKKVNAEADVEQAKADSVRLGKQSYNLFTDPNTLRGIGDFFSGSSSALQSMRTNAAKPNPALFSEPTKGWNGFDGKYSRYRFYNFKTRQYSTSRPSAGVDYVERKDDGTVRFNFNKRSRR